MRIQHKVIYCALQPRAEAAIHSETRAGNLGGRRRIENAQRVAYFPMRLRLKAEYGRRKMLSYLLVFSVVLADGHSLIWNIWNGQQGHLKIGLGGSKLVIKRFYPIAYFLHAGDASFFSFLSAAT